MESILGRAEGLVQPPQTLTPPLIQVATNRHHGILGQSGTPTETTPAKEGAPDDIHVEELRRNLPRHVDDKQSASNDGASNEGNRSSANVEQSSTTQSSATGSSQQEEQDPRPRDFAQAHRQDSVVSGKGQAHDPAEDGPTLLHVGPGGESDYDGPSLAVSESPPAANINIYETAYRNEVQRIREAQGSNAIVYLTKRVDKLKGRLEESGILTEGSAEDRPKIRWANILEKTKMKVKGASA